MELEFFCDHKRHLVCKPYSLENLHEMARQLDIKYGWFHRDHYDIPKNREEEIRAKCTIVTARDILRIIQSANDLPERLQELYDKLWLKLPRRKTCSCCGTVIYGDNKTIYWDHILDKSVYPDFALEEWNLLFVCGDCHAQKSMGHPTEKHQKIIAEVKENCRKLGLIK
jgi:hypothetical protein